MARNVRREVYLFGNIVKDGGCEMVNCVITEESEWVVTLRKTSDITLWRHHRMDGWKYRTNHEGVTGSPDLPSLPIILGVFFLIFRFPDLF